MGRPPTSHFLIFGDPDAPQRKVLSAEEAAQLEAEHERTKLRQFRQLVHEFAALNALGENRSVLYRMVSYVQDLGKDEQILEQYVQTELSDPKYAGLREFVREVHLIDTSEAKESATVHVPQWTSRLTVRCAADGYLVIDRLDERTAQRTSDDYAGLAALWVRVVDGWSQGGDWGGHLLIASATAKDRYLDSSDGWVRPVATPGDPVMFYAMGSHYEIWQKDRETGRPLTTQDNRLRFVRGALPEKWNIRACT